MVGTTLNNIHATVGSITITWNPHHRSVESPAGSIFYRQQVENAKAEQYANRKISTRSSEATTLVACAPLPFCFGQKRLKTLPHYKRQIMSGMRDLHAPIRKHHLSVQDQSKYCEFLSTTFELLGLIFFWAKN